MARIISGLETMIGEEMGGAWWWCSEPSGAALNFNFGPYPALSGWNPRNRSPREAIHNPRSHTAHFPSSRSAAAIMLYFTGFWGLCEYLNNLRARPNIACRTNNQDRFVSHRRSRCIYRTPDIRVMAGGNDTCWIHNRNVTVNYCCGSAGLHCNTWRHRLRLLPRRWDPRHFRGTQLCSRARRDRNSELKQFVSGIRSASLSHLSRREKSHDGAIFSFTDLTGSPRLSQADDDGTKAAGLVQTGCEGMLKLAECDLLRTCTNIKRVDMCVFGSRAGEHLLGPSRGSLEGIFECKSQVKWRLELLFAPLR